MKNKSIFIAEFLNLRKALNLHFSKDEIDFLYEFSSDFQPKFLTHSTLSKYFSAKKVSEILAGETYFFDLVKQTNYGRFELEFCDKLLQLMEKHHIKKEHKIFDQNIAFGIQGYTIEFMKDEEYADGLMFYFGELIANCASIGKSASDICLFDAFSENSRLVLIRKGNQIIGASPIYIDLENKSFVIASLKCDSYCTVKLKNIKFLVEYFSAQLLIKNPNFERVVIGICGASLANLGFNCFTRRNAGTAEYQSLGKIKSSSLKEEELHSLQNELQIIENATKYPILETKFFPADGKHFFTLEEGGKKDFAITAEIINRNVLEKKILQIEKSIHEMSPANLNGKTNQHPKKAIVFKNVVSEFLNQKVAKELEVMLTQSSTRICYFIILPKLINKTDLHELYLTLTSMLLSLPRNIYRQTKAAKDEKSLSITFMVPQSFFGERRIKASNNPEGSFKSFLENIESKKMGKRL